jgi:N-dimethylarginine dimethylaminohydrolase
MTEYNGIILIGNGNIYNPKYCDKVSLKLKNVNNVINELKHILKKLNIKVIQPRYNKNINMCKSLWVRDTSILINNHIYILPPNIINNKYRNNQIQNEINTIPYQNEGKFIPENINMDGGDLLIDNKTIFIGKGTRTDNSAFNYLTKQFTNYNVIQIKHHALHLDCCLTILPNNIILYSKQYIKQIPSIVRSKYKCVQIEHIIGGNIDVNLAANILLIKNVVITAYDKRFIKLYKYMEDLNLIVKTIPFSNIFTDGGGLRCMTQWYKLPKIQTIY